MAFLLEPFRDVGLTEPLLRHLLERHENIELPRLRRLHAYYRNERAPGRTPGSRGALAQEEGLPDRLRPNRSPDRDDRARDREVVIENDIAWRVHVMVDFMFGRAPTIESLAPDASVRAAAERAVNEALEASGGAALLQDLGLLLAVYGHADLLLRADALFDGPRPARPASALRVELLEPTRVIPILDPGDYRVIRAIVIRHTRETGAVVEESGLKRIARSLALRAPEKRAAVDVVEIISATRRQVYENERLVADEENPLGFLPVSHIQNTSQPFRYEGLGEVEPLIPLQDELNTRLSDRANRVTMQAFRMYLAKGLDLPDGRMGALRVGPGQIWCADNPEASVEEFGGDSASPGEDRHIDDVRAALDKASGVTPLAAGILSGRIGNLSSENALRVTLLGLAAKTTRKQAAAGRGIALLGAHVLAALDRAGELRTDPADRSLAVRWPDPIPRNEREQLEAALLKQQLGVAREQILADLGYAARA